MTRYRITLVVEERHLKDIMQAFGGLDLQSGDSVSVTVGEERPKPPSGGVIPSPRATELAFPTVAYNSGFPRVDLSTTTIGTLAKTIAYYSNKKPGDAAPPYAPPPTAAPKPPKGGKS